MGINRGEKSKVANHIIFNSLLLFSVCLKELFLGVYSSWVGIIRGEKLKVVSHDRI